MCMSCENTPLSVLYSLGALSLLSLSPHTLARSLHWYAYAVTHLCTENKLKMMKMHLPPHKQRACI